MVPEPVETKQVKVDFTLQFPTGQMHVSVPVSAERIDLVQLIPSVAQITSDIAGAVVQTLEAHGQEISCRAGCAACCRQLVPVTLFELEDLANRVRRLTPEQQAILESRFNAALVRLKERGVLDQLDFQRLPDSASESEFQLKLAYLHAGVRCPFLENEMCSIHPFRPLACREYLVTSAPEHCATLSRDAVREVAMPITFSTPLADLAAQVTAEKLGWMPLVFLFSWIRSGMSIAKAYEGTGQELLRLVVERIAKPVLSPTSAQEG